MSKITLDPGLRARLNGLDEQLEICDDTGRTVGHFLPDEVYRKLLYQVAEAQCPYTAEQLAAARQQTGGQSLHEWQRSTGRS